MCGGSLLRRYDAQSSSGCRLCMQQPSAHAPSCRVCVAHLHLLVQAIMQYQGVCHLHAVRLHWMAGAVVVGPNVRIIEVGNLQDHHAGHCGAIMPTRSCGFTEHAAIMNVVHIHRLTTARNIRRKHGTLEAACRARRGGRAHLFLSAAHCGQTRRLTVMSPVQLTSACSAKSPKCRAASDLQVRSRMPLAGRLIPAVSCKCGWRRWCPRSTTNHFEVPLSALSASFAEITELASASLRQRCQSQPYRGCNAGQMER
jgi:hypothetical protein